MALRSKVLETVRAEIVEGKIRPGQRIPNRSEMQVRFGVSSHTVQRAMSRLIRDGFLVSRGRSGTFVVDNPPHAHRYGVVFPIHLDEPHGGTWARLWGALDRQAAVLCRTRDVDIVSYYGVMEHADTVDWRRLRADLAAHRLAGLILSSPNHLPDLAYLAEGVPCVGFRVESHDLAGVPAVELSLSDMAARAVSELATAGCQRVAVLAPDAMSPRLADAIQSSIAENGMVTQPHWRLGVNPRYSHWTANCVHAMLHPGQDELPDALFVTDDALLDAALAGLMDLGLRPGRDITLVSHANFPVPKASPWPIIRVGFDIRVVLDAFLDLINRQTQGDATVPQTTTVPVTIHVAPETRVARNAPTN